MKRQLLLCHHRASRWNVRQVITCLIYLCLCGITPALAQTHNVDFDADKWSGCEPLAVQFRNLSDPGYSSLNWNFSVGADVSDPNPARIFNTPGVYKITLTVTYPDGAVIAKEKNITVYKKPAAAFSVAPSNGCTPLAVTFTDQSDPGDGTIASITWDFGDGINGTGSTATHTYTLGGVQTASLIVTNSYGCSNGATQQITVQDAPDVQFTSDRQGSCTTPFIVNFQNNTTVANNVALSYRWDFGDGTTSTATNPQHTYTREGAFTVTLTATTPGGCTQTLTMPDYIQISQMQPDFAPDGSVCAGQPVLLVNRTLPAPTTARWVFPDSSVQQAVNARYTFPSAGDYTVTMTATSAGCEETVTKTIHVNPLPDADFTATPNPACSVPANIQFTAQAPDATAWTWNFGNGGSATTQNPAHTYTAEGFYTVTLQATSATGCTRTVAKQDYIRVQEPSVSFTPSVHGGCIPIDITFTPAVFSADPVTRYTWNFGDGGSSSLAQPTHTFTVQGDYTVTLEIETRGGCTASYSMPISVGERVAVDFEVDHTEGCQEDIFRFTNKSVPAGTQWFWDFPQDNSAESTEHPNHQFTYIGEHDVRLTVVNHGCYNVLIKEDYITINPPAARFNVSPDCVNKYERQFNDASDFGPSGTPQSWLWDFGDGTTSTEQSPRHTFPRTGTYQVQLTVSNGSCTSAISQFVHIIDEKPAIRANTSSICAGRSVSYSITSRLTYDMIAGYVWDFGDGSGYNVDAPNFDPNAVYTHTYSNPGTYKVSLYVLDINGCPHYSDSLQITVNGVNADFTYTGRCREAPFTFTDASVAAFPTTTISSWTWDFGDGSAPVTQQQKPNGYGHTFDSMATFPVTLTVTDQFGCTSNTTKQVTVNTVDASIVVPGQEACQQKVFNFSNNSIGNGLTYAWSFGDGGTSTEGAPEHTYTAAGVYTVTLEVTDADGCKDSQVATNFITVRNPEADFSFPATLPPCPPVLVPFTNNSSDYDGVAWQFGDGSTSPEISPGHAYSRPGTYTVELRVYTDGGCFSTFTRDLTIQGPDGSQSATPTTGCWPLQINMTAQSSNAVKYIWDFDDGHVVTTTTPTTAYEYTKEGIYYPRVILEDAKGCQVPALGSDTIVVDKVMPHFTIDNTQACDGGYVYFRDSSRSITKDQLGMDMTYQWDFGIDSRTDDTGAGANPRFFYDTTGTYFVRLLATSTYGCTGEVTLPVVVEPQPEAEILPIEPVCAGSEVKLRGREIRQLPGTKWVWQVAGQTFETADPPRIPFENPGNNPVQLTISNGNGTCPDVAEAVVQVDALPVLQPVPQQAKICRGESIQLQSNVSTGTEVTWTGTNISDPRSPAPTVSPEQDAVYHVLAENSAGCTREADVFITVTQPLEVTAADVAICEGKSVQLHASGAPRYKWIPQTGLNRDDVADPMASPSATTTYQVIGSGDDACFTDTTEVTVTVNPSPQVSAGPDQVVPVGAELRLQLQSTPDVTRVEWQPATYLSCTDCLAPLAQPKSNITYHVTASNQYNCISIDDINIKLVCESGSVFLPNSFSPNGDGQNDIFYVRGRGIKTIKVFRIFNRWGQLVFERNNLTTEDPASGWDGRVNGTPLPPDVFIYYAEMVCDTNESFTLKGNVTLLR
ncbi:gliding motility-associated-like protein [Chitinophaga japonensis]|uniref:Gliding motility-associated-like protein n=1 Tax=Chitinophaga japonensis TaxID=104662 RepID=A0A562TAN1_CHIJA|nr:gliding motility-associated-like protein [Chitinophaga japonensis]